MRRLLLAVFMGLLLACSSNKVEENDKYVSATLSDDSQTIKIVTDSIDTYKYNLTVGDICLDSGNINKQKNISIWKQLKKYKEPKELAFIGANSNSIYKIYLKISDKVDTIFNYKREIVKDSEIPIAFTGFGAPLIRRNVAVDVESDLRIWLYRNNRHLSDSLFNLFKSIYKDIIATDYIDYVPQGEIPVVHDIDGFKYKVNSDVKADYYAVVACQNQTFIDQYIEKLVGSNFKGVATSLSNALVCDYAKGTTGYRNVFLLCINKDWTYRQYPLSTFALDNEAPNSEFIGERVNFVRRRIMNSYDSSRSERSDEPKELRYKSNIRVVYPNKSPLIYGTALVEIPDWDGNGLECNVTFTVHFDGDTKSVTIQRRDKRLCYYNKYTGYHFEPEDKVILAKEHKSPYTFSYQMHFEGGDYFIPVIVEDYHGNKTMGNVKVHAKFVRRDSPSINIENNIDNNIYND